MTVFEPDLRQIIQPDDDEFSNSPYSAVVAVDTQIGTVDSSGNAEVRKDFEGSGIAITPVHVLTAAHNVYDIEAEDSSKADPIASRVTPSAEQPDLISRIIGNSEDPDANVDRTDINFLANDFRQTSNDNDDIALLRANSPFLRNENQALGLIAFVNPRDAIGFDVETAGYPDDNVSQPILDRDGRSGSRRPGRDLVAAPGLSFPPGMVQTTQNPRLFFTNEDVDLWEGQSGSGVWHSFEDEDLRILGLFNFDDPNIPDDGNELIELNGGVIFTTDLYTEIIDKTEDDIGTESADRLPENLIIGSNSSSNDLINGTYRKERIIGRRGDDTISGAGADDRLEGGEGDDRLKGGDGDDLIDGGTNPLLSLNPFNLSGSDVAVYRANRSEYDIDTQTSGGILGSPIGEQTVTVITHLNNGIDGQDTLSNVEFLHFADGTVPLSSNDDDDDPDGQLSFDGTSGNDRLFGNTLGNLLRGEAGNDRLEGRDGNDTLEGGNGFDILKGEDDNDSLVGGGFRDTLLGGAGNDTIEGDNGNDLIYGSFGFDTIYGGEDNDTISGGNQRDLLVGDGGDDEINGGNHSDSIFGKIEDDLLRGQNGNDTLFGGDGEDSLEGGNNRDRLAGGEDDDTLTGGADIDRLDGGSGDDLLTGGSGRDNFVFNSLEEGTDTITDFSPQDDTMWFVKEGFDGISTKGMISSQMLRIGSDATTTNHRFIYNSGSGDLFYDSDGSGSSARVLLAELDSGLALTNADFRML